MKRIALLLVVSLCATLFPACSQKYPEFAKRDIIKDGDFLIKEGFYKNASKEYPKKIKADYIAMAVKENRNDPQSRIITIPVLRIHSLSTTPKEPVFILNGGPGGTNLGYAPIWLIDQHDIIIVGYRGVDGSTKLYFKAFGEAIVVDSNTFTLEHLKEAGTVLNQELESFSQQNIDLNSYNIIEVVDDIENARNILGFNKINLYATSYGTRLAYIYGLRYPQSIHRACCQRINPPGGFCWNPDVEDSILKEYGELWKQDTSNLKRSPDIILTIKKVFASLPTKWKKIYIDPEKVRVCMFQLLYSTDGAAQIFDAFIAAENGDYSGLASLVMFFDVAMGSEAYYGDYAMKAITADYIAGKNYTTGLDSKENLLGATQSKLFAIIEFSDFNFKLIPEEYRKPDTSYVNMLLINGNLDVANPVINAKELIRYLPNGKLVVLSDCSHNDVAKQRDEFIGLVKEYFLTGQVDTSNFKRIPANLCKPEKSLQQMGKTFYTLKKLGLLKMVAKMAK